MLYLLVVSESFCLRCCGYDEHLAAWMHLKTTPCCELHALASTFRLEQLGQRFSAEVMKGLGS